MKAVLLIAIVTLFTAGSRYYWPIDLAKYAQTGSPHTHVEITGYVTYTAAEDDGDLHIRLCDSPSVVGMDKAHCVICECIPLLPCAKPALKSHITVQGITRFDPEHGWRELHPVELIK